MCHHLGPYVRDGGGRRYGSSHDRSCSRLQRQLTMISPIWRACIYSAFRPPCMEHRPRAQPAHRVDHGSQEGRAHQAVSPLLSTSVIGIWKYCTLCYHSYPGPSLHPWRTFSLLHAPRYVLPRTRRRLAYARYACARVSTMRILWASNPHWMY